MAGTDTSRVPDRLDGPTIVLITPQLGENIGTCARAMLNCGLSDLRIVRPRDGWPSERARAAASGADVVLDAVRVFDRTEDAVADLNRLYATTARDRYMIKPVVTPKGAARETRAATAAGETVGYLFGGERAGLTNEDVALADAILNVPLNPAFASLNLAQAVLLTAYAWREAGDETPDRQLVDRGDADGRPATRDHLHGLFEHLEGELEAARFFKVEEKKPSMIRAIRNLITRSHPTEQEVRTLHGIVTALSGRRKGGAPRIRPGVEPDTKSGSSDLTDR